MDRCSPFRLYNCPVILTHPRAEPSWPGQLHANVAKSRRTCAHQQAKTISPMLTSTGLGGRNQRMKTAPRQNPHRPCIKAIVNCVQLTAADTVCDPAAGTGGFLLAAHDFVNHHQAKDLDKDQKRHLRTKFVKGWQLVPNTARLCIMNL